MSLDLSRLEKPRISGGKTIARCPACAETGNDTGADHLFINSDGKFGCVLYQSTDGTEHRKRIFELAGIADVKPPRDKSTWTALASAPPSAPFPSLKHFKHGMPVSHWIYGTASGDMAGIVARFDLPDGRKETLPLAWCRDQDGRTEWRWKSMTDPRPLYGLPLTEDFVVLVEGEKCADAVLAAGIPATTWAGGSSAMHKTDFSPLKGKTVVIWPDADAPGQRALASLVHILSGIAGAVLVVPIPDGMPEGWDAADTTPAEISRLVADASPLPEDEPDRDCFDEQDDMRYTDRIQEMPFRLLGMDDGVMRYMPDNGQHIVSIPPCGHSKLNLMQLAPLQTWESVFPGKSAADWEAAANSLIQFSQSMPKFDPRSIRGRGCWIDGDDVIYHAGNKIAVNGVIGPIQAYNSPTRAIYEGGLSISIDTGDISRNAESAKIIELCDALPFDQPLLGKMLAGWMALAPICGALSWRPHIWVTGASGSGKSWITGNIIFPLAGKSAIYVKGNTSEAGIRGRIGCDALPVLFDEAEAENQRSIPRMDGVMELARQSSSEDGGGIVKGTQNGGSVTYMVRSMFCFASIGVAAVKKADTSRISVLSLRKDNNPAQFDAVKALWRATAASPAYCSRFRARAVRNAMTTRANAEVFCEAATAFTGDKRSADQVGTLLAGAFSLTSTKPISVAAATAWLEKQDWSGFKVDAVDSDENQCLAHLLSCMVRVEKQYGTESITLDEAIERARMGPSPSPEELALQRMGIKIATDSVTVSNTHQGLERAFSDTPWAGSKWKGQLLRVPGALQERNPVRFGPSVVQRAVKIPCF